MAAPRISVVIPTRDRRETLRQCLAALAAQDYPRELFEIIIADDGSTDGTADEIAPLLAGRGRCLRQEPKGPAAARNLGVKAAAGELVLFTGDDMLASPGLLAAHAAWHDAHPGVNEALLGYVAWNPAAEITPFMRWLENGGPQFRYGELAGKDEADPRRFFYTCNISLKRSFLLEKGLFDEEFPYAAYEDAELGLRLAAKGLKLGYSRAAWASHEHFTSLAAACARMERVGESRVLLERKTALPPAWPDKGLLRRLLSSLKLAVYYPLAKWYESRAVNGPVFGYVLDSYFLKGLRKGRERSR